MRQGALRVVKRQPREKIPGFLAMADVLVSPRAYGDNLPLKIFDYLAAGKPIVATDIPAHRALLDDESALLTGAWSPELASGIVKAAARPGAGGPPGRSGARAGRGALRMVPVRALGRRAVPGLRRWLRRRPGTGTAAVAAMAAMAAVIVSHDTRDHLRACLASVRAAAPAETVVADTGSTDGSAEMVRRDFPEALLLADGGEPRLRRGGEPGRRRLRLALRPAPQRGHARRAGGAAGVCGEYLEAHPRAAVAGPRLVNPDGSLQVSCFPYIGTFQLMLEKTPLGRWLARIPAVRDRWLLCHWPHDRPRAVPWVLGAAFALRREAFEAIGGFDPSFFMYSEEIDLCYRLNAAGWEVHFAPVTTVMHVGGASTGQRRPEMAVRRVASSKLFYRRHYSRLRAAALEGMIGAAMLARLLRDGLRLAVARDPAERSRLAEDLSVWRGALRSGPP